MSIETDILLDDALKYVKYLNDIDVNNIEMTTIPGEARTVGGKAYFIHDEEGTKELVDKIFLKKNKKKRLQRVTVRMLNRSVKWRLHWRAGSNNEQ